MAGEHLDLSSEPEGGGDELRGRSRRRARAAVCGDSFRLLRCLFADIRESAGDGICGSLSAVHEEGGAEDWAGRDGGAVL